MPSIEGSDKSRPTVRSLNWVWDTNLLDWVFMTQPGGGGGGGGAVTVADGADVAEGATTDVAVNGDNPGTISAKLRGLNKLFSDVWDSVNHWLQVKVMNTVTVGGTVAVSNMIPAVETGLAKDSSLATLHTDLTGGGQHTIVDSGTVTANLGTGMPSVTATALLQAQNDAVTIAVDGMSGVGFFIPAGLTASVTPEYSIDGGATWAQALFVTASTGVYATTAALAGATKTANIFFPGGASHVRVRVTSVSPSGSATATLRATAGANNQALPVGTAGSGVGSNFLIVGGPDGSTGSNRLTVKGASTIPAATDTSLVVTLNPVDYAGVDGASLVATHHLKIGGKTNDITPKDGILPLGASARSVIVEGFAGGTAVPVSGTVTATVTNDGTFAKESGGNLATIATNSANLDTKLSLLGRDTSLATLIAILADMRTEMQIQTEVLAQTLNFREDLDEMRQDPYYARSGGTNGGQQ